MKILGLLLLTVSVNANAAYFFSGFGGAGSASRGLETTTGHIGFGTEVYNGTRWAVDVEAQYTEVGRSTGNVLTSKNEVDWNPVMTSPEKPSKPVPLPEIPNQPIIEIDIPLPLPAPRIPMPVIVKPDPEPVPEPEQEPEEKEIVLPIDDELGQNLRKKAAAGGNSSKVVQKIPSARNQYYSLSVNPRYKVSRFLWLNFKFAAEKKILDGRVVTKQGANPRELYWTSSEKFSDDGFILMAGAGARAIFNKQLSGYINLDYRDSKGEAENVDFQDNEYFVSTGLRFKF